MRSFLIPAVLALGTASSVLGQYVPTASPVILTRAGNQFQVTWQGADQRFYQLEESPDMLDWMEIGPVFPGTGTRLGYTNTNTAARHFYRVRELAMRPGFDQIEFGRNDDLTYPDCDAEHAVPAKVDIGFPLLLFGQTHTQCYVNNNGNITFDLPLEDYTPYDLGSQDRVMIAPFWADVDTRLSEDGPPRSSLTRFSATPGTANGRPAFGVTWRGVGYFGYNGAHADKLNHFQLLLINRSDISAGDFDMEFNYHRIQWETGDASGGYSGLGGSPARVGWANGVGRYMEFKGSGQTLAFLDRRPGEMEPNLADGLIYQMWNSTVPGRIVIPVRGGIPVSETGYEFQVDAGADQTLALGADREITLTGAVNPPGVTGVTHEWIQISPTSPLAAIASPTSWTTTAVLPEPLRYKFRLNATKQGTFSSSSSDEVIVVHPDTISVFAGYYYYFEETEANTFELDQAFATYNDSDMTDVEWEQLAGEPCDITTPNAIIPEVVFPGPGAYGFRLTGRSGGLPQWEQSSEAFVTIAEPTTEP